MKNSERVTLRVSDLLPPGKSKTGWHEGVCYELHKMQQEDLFCDVYLTTGDDDPIPAHSCVISANSAYLKSLLLTPPPELRATSQTVLRVDGSWNKNTLVHALDFIYTGTVNVAYSEVKEILALAMQLELAHLQTVCKAVLKNGRATVMSMMPPLQVPLKTIVKTEPVPPLTTMDIETEDFTDLNGIMKQYKDGTIHDLAYPCHACPKVFKSPGMLQNHVRHMHLMTNRLKCTKCNVCFKVKNALKYHLKRHAERKFKCKHCPKTFFTKGDMTLHSHTHAKPKKPYNCGTCGKMFSKRILKNRHAFLAHGKRIQTMKTYECLTCCKRFVSAREFGNHSRLKHSLYQCPICSTLHTTEQELQNHVIVDHQLTNMGLVANARRQKNKKARFFCDVPDCEYKTYHPGNIKRHKLAHERGTARPFVPAETAKIVRKNPPQPIVKDRKFEYVCQYDGCSFRSRYPYSLTRHHQSHKRSKEVSRLVDMSLAAGDDEICRCTKCGLVFENMDDLTEHLEQDHDNKTDQEQADEEESASSAKAYRYACCPCEMFFRTMEELTQHAEVAHSSSTLKQGSAESDETSEQSSARGGRVKGGSKRSKVIKYECTYPGCTYLTCHKYNFQRHEIAHNSPGRLGGRTTSKKFLLKSMIKDAIFKCCRCNMAYGTLQELDQHVTAGHISFQKKKVAQTKNTKDVKQQFMCSYPECKFTSNLRFHINRHLKDHENGLTDNKASEPEEAVAPLQQYPGSVDSSGNAIKDEQNNVSISVSETEIEKLYESVNVKGPKRAHCELCDRTFVSTQALQSHNRYRHKEEGNKPESSVLQCNTCNRVFGRMSRLRRHIACVHLKIRRFRCTQCSYKSYDVLPVITHFSQHHPEIPQPEEREFVIPGANYLVTSNADETPELGSNELGQ